MAWVTFEDLLAKAGVTGASSERVDPFGAQGSSAPVFNASNLKSLNKNEAAALSELYDSAREVMKQAGVPPDSVRQVSNVTDSGDFSYEIPNWNLDTIRETLAGRGVKLAYDPSRDKGNWGSSRSYSIQLGLLDAAGNPVQEFRTGEGSLASGFFKGFVVPFAQIALMANAGAIGAAIAPTASSTVQSAIGSAVASGAGTALAGGDAEDVIKNALTGGAVGAASSLVKPYIQDAINFVKDLTPEGLQDVVAAAGDAGDVAGNVADVDVGGAALNADQIGMQAYDNAIAAGLPHQEAMNVAIQEAAAFSAGGTSGELSGFSPTANANALSGNVAPIVPPTNALINDPYAGLAENFPVAPPPTDFTPAPVTPSPGVASVDLTAGQLPYDPYTGLAENFPTTTPPIIPPVAETGAGLGAAGTAAGVAGTGVAAGAAGAGTAAGAGGQMTAADLEGLDPNVTLGGGTDALGGTDVTGGTGAIVTGAAGGAGAGAITAGGAAAAGLTGIPVVDDFLSYLGTPAGAAALGAFGSLASGYITGQAAKDAAQIQAQSAQNALALQREQFEYQKGLLEPYRKAGESALGRLTGVMGLGGQPAQPQQLLEMDPGYAFRLGEGMKALERVQAARGNMLSGGAIKAGQRYAQDFASGEYGNAYNRLANIAGLGQTVGGQLGTAAQQFGQTAGETMSQGANALAAGRIGRTSGYMGGIGGAVGAYQNYQNQQQQNQLFRDIYGRMGL